METKHAVILGVAFAVWYVTMDRCFSTRKAK